MSKQKTIFEINFSSLATLLLVLFIGLKLGNVIAWSWWWVLSPLWLPWVLFAAAFCDYKNNGLFVDRLW